MTEERKPVSPPAAERQGGFPSFPEGGSISRELREIVKLSADFERRLGQALTVNATDLTAMQHLIESGPLSPSELSARLRISTAAATMVVDRLEAVGHVERQPHPDDRRKIVVVPREESVRRTANELMPLIGGVAGVIAALPPDEAEIIERFLGQVVGHYRRVLEE